MPAAWTSAGRSPAGSSSSARSAGLVGAWWPNKWLLLVPGVLGAFSVPADVGAYAAGQHSCELHAGKGNDGKWAGMVGALTVT